MTIKEMKVEISQRDKLIKIIEDIIDDDTAGHLGFSDEQRNALISAKSYFYLDRNNLQRILDNTEIEIDNIIRLYNDDF
jgi:hypothetical protein